MKEVNSMKYLLMTEYETMKVYELDNVIYKKIEYKLVKLTGSEQIAKKLMVKFSSLTIQQLSCNSYINIFDCFEILG